MKDLILKYTLKNASDYNGKANFNSVLGKILSENPKLKENIKDLVKEINKTIKEVNSLSLEEQKSKLENYTFKEVKKEEHVLPKLQNVSGEVVTRIAPYPSGPLHIGNARPAILNDEYAKMYHGKMFLVIDDTIGSIEKPILKEAYKLIPEGLKWLKIKFSKIYYKSSRLKIYYKYAEEIIKLDKAYVCFCSPEKLRENRANQIECNCRSASVKENLDNWKKMFKMKEGKATLRIKTSLQHPNPAFRDRVIFKISDRIHPKVGKKYKVWPLLDFSWAVDDHLLGITHIIRGKELMIESEMEKYIWDIFKWPHQEIIHTGLLQISGIKLSKSKSQQEVMSGKYIGWDDPRTFSLQSLERRGIRPEAIRKFCLSFGLTQTEITVPIENLYIENKKLIDKTTKRYFVVFNSKKIKIENAPKLKVKAPLHPENNYGYRNFTTGNEFYVQDKIEKNKNYRFMHLFNFKDNKFISQELDRSLDAKLIHWLPVSKDLVNVEVLMDDGQVIKGLGENNLKKVKVNKIVQFERQFFAKLDKKEKNKLIFWFTHK
ncbi:MAG: glutamate--tRNA ligase [Nanoarchaeota archaeon]